MSGRYGSHGWYGNDNQEQNVSEMRVSHGTIMVWKGMKRTLQLSYENINKKAKKPFATPFWCKFASNLRMKAIRLLWQCQFGMKPVGLVKTKHVTCVRSVYHTFGCDPNCRQKKRAWKCSLIVFQQQQYEHHEQKRRRFNTHISMP